MGKKESEESVSGKRDSNKSKKVHMHKRRVKRKGPRNSLWMWTSFILAAVLIITLTTDNFAGNNTPAELTDDIDNIISKVDDTELTAALNDIKNDLIEADSIYAELSAKNESPKKPPITGDATASETEEETSGSGAKSSVDMQFYVMSQCPYGTQVVDAIAPVKEKLGSSLDLMIDYIFYPEASYAGKEDQFCVDGLCSMHGVPEVNGNIVQLCAMKYNPDSYLKMLLCQYKDAGAIPGNWETCAENNGLDVESIKGCFEGEEGKELARASSKKASDAGATGSPTILMNGAPYSGGRTETDFMRAICNAFEGERPKACADVPEPVKLGMIALSSEECTACDTSQIEQVSKQLFPGLEVREVDISSAEGKKLLDKYSIELLPAYLFERNITQTDTWKSRPQLQSAFEEIKDTFKLRDSQTGASYYADEEKREEAERIPKEALGVVADDNMPQLDFFVMSFCPYGIQAENGIIPVQETLGDSAEFVPHFVIYPSGTGCRTDSDGTKYCSMHGAGELEEDIRQLCIYNEDKANFFPYIKKIAEGYEAGEISSSNIESKWKDIAEEVGVDTAKVEECYNDSDRVLEMLRAESELNQLLGVQGSPTIFIEGSEFSGGRSPAAYQAALCSKFTDAPAECEEALSDSGAAASGSC